MHSVRLDVWLDVACLFKTRSEAQRACKGGKVDVNGQPAKPHRDVRVGDEVEISRGFGHKQKVRVRGLVEQRRAARLFRAAVTPPHSPDKRARRELRKMRGKS